VSSVWIAPAPQAVGDSTIVLSRPVLANLVLYRGDSGRLKLTVTSEGAPVDVSAATWDADVRATADSPEVLATLTITPVAGDTGSVWIDLPASESEKLTISPAVYDVQMTLDGTVRTLLAGTVTITKDVSRAT
jgi:hypothetical protein